jgi:hypothetical protein
MTLAADPHGYAHLQVGAEQRPMGIWRGPSMRPDSSHCRGVGCQKLPLVGKTICQHLWPGG